MKKTIITALNDAPKYVDYLKVMLISLSENAPEEKIRVYQLGYNLDLSCLNPNVEIIPYRHPRHKNEVSHIRGEILNTILPDFDKVAWMDPDIIIRKPLDGFWKELAPGTLQVTYRKWQDVEYRKFQDGIYGIGVSDSTKALIARMRKKLSKHTEWYSDQLYLYRCYKKYKKNIRLVNLPRIYNDNHYEKESAIWHCHMKDKDSSKVFNKEFKKYLGIANETIG